MASKTYTSNGITVTCKVDLREDESSISKASSSHSYFTNIHIPAINISVSWDATRHPTAVKWGIANTLYLDYYTDTNDVKRHAFSKNISTLRKNNGDVYTVVAEDSTLTWDVQVSYLFNTANPTTVFAKIYYCDFFSGMVVNLYDSNGQRVATPNNSFPSWICATQRVELLQSVFSVPCNLTASDVTYTDNRVIAGHVNAMVHLTQAQFRFGSRLRSLYFAIGTDSDSYLGTAYTHAFSLPLTKAGTFRGRIVATDTRGFSTELSLGNIEVQQYVKPRILNAEVIRTDRDGKDADDGTYIVFSGVYNEGMNGLKSNPPSYRVVDQDGNDVQESGAWYRYKDSNGVNTPISTAAWLTHDGRFYCLMEVSGGGFVPEKSYTVFIVPVDEFLEEGNTISVTVPPAFFTVDFLAGGHGIAFGKLSTREGFDCDMDTYFKDMTSQEVSAFINNLNIFLN